VTTSSDERRRQVAVEQYASSTTKLDARAALHRHFSIATQPWHEWVLAQIALAPGETLVEVGAGTGLLWTANVGGLPGGSRLHLTDMSMAMCRRLRAQVPEATSVCCSDAQQLPFRGQVADVLVANHMLYHVPDQQAALSEAARVLRRTGRAVFATNGGEHMKELASILTAVGLPSLGSDPTHRAFTLEAAPDVVGSVFPRVELAEFRDGLRVTEPDALVAYIESFAAVNAEQRRRLREEIKARMVDGCLAITKSAGIVKAALT